MYCKKCATLFLFTCFIIFFFFHSHDGLLRKASFIERFAIKTHAIIMEANYNRTRTEVNE